MTDRKPSRTISLTPVWRFVSGFPVLIIAGGIILSVLSALYASQHLRLNSDQNRLVSPEVPFHKRYLGHLQNFGDQEYIYVVVRTWGTVKGRIMATRFVESLARRLEKRPDQIQKMYYRLMPEELGSSALLFASLEEVNSLSQMVAHLAPHLVEWQKDGSLAGFIDQLTRLLESNPGGRKVISPSVIGRAFAVMASFLKAVDDAVADNRGDRSLFELPGDEKPFFFTSDGKLLIMRLLPAKDFRTMSVISKPIETVRDALAATLAEYPELEAGVTGRPVLQNDEMETTDGDMTRAAVLAIIVVGLLFIVVLHGWRRPLMILVTLIIAIGWTFGFATAAVGELNLLSIVFTLVLIGIGVDFGVHIVTRYTEERMVGLSNEEAVRTAILNTGPGIIMGAVTSVCAFYAVLGSDFQGLAELGLIGGTGILLCMAAMLTMLPVMLRFTGGSHASTPSAPRVIGLTFMGRVLRRPGWILLILFAVTIAAVPLLRNIRFSYNLLELQARGLESVEYERLLIESADESTWFAIFTADDLDAVARLQHNLRAVPSVGKIESIADFIPRNQHEKLALFSRTANIIGNIPAEIAEPMTIDPQVLVNSMTGLYDALEATQEKLFTAGATAELVSLEESMGYIQSARNRIQEVPQRALRLEGLESDLRLAVKQAIQQMRQWRTAEPVGPNDLPESIRNLYIGKDGRYQVKASPREDIWDFDKLQHFVSELREVDPNVSGVPVGVFESARLMHRTFLFAAGITVVLVSIILYMYARSVTYVAITLLPLAVGTIWLLQIMALLGLSFNLANFFAVPILIAIGVDGSIHLVRRWQELESHGGLFHTSTPIAVVLSFSTTMIGFGGLLFAHHRGLASLGKVMVLGSLTSMLACVLVLPATLEWLRKIRAPQGDR